MSSVHRSLFAQFAASIAPTPEVVVGADADDDNASTAPSNASSTASLFAGGTREIDVLLRSAKAAIDAKMAQWYERRSVYGFANQADIERTKREEEISKAEDVDQIRVEIGHDIHKWVTCAIKNLDQNEINDRQIRHRMAKYVDRQRKKLEEFGFLMERDASPEMIQWCTLPTADLIMEKVDGRRTSTPVDDLLEKQIDAADNNPQDALLLGSEAANLRPTIPALPRLTSPHAYNAIQEMAQQMEDERKEQEEIVRKQKQQMEEMKEKIDAEVKRKKIQQQKAQKQAQAQAQAQAFNENQRRQEEEAHVRELQQQLALSRKQFEEMRSENERMLERMRDSLQQQIIDSEPNDDFQPVLNRSQKRKTPPKSVRPPRQSRNPFAQEVNDLADIINDPTLPKYAVNAAMDLHHQRRINHLVNDPVTAAISEESTMRRKMMAIQRLAESRPAKKVVSGDPLSYRNLMARFDIAVKDEALDDTQRLFELAHWFEGSVSAMIETYASFPDASAAYQQVRAELDKVFGARCDSVVPIIRQLSSGSVIKDGDHAAHLELFTQLVSADATATTLKQRQLLDRFDYCGIIIEKRLPHLAERWWRRDQEQEMRTGKGFGFDDLKDFVSNATRICAKRENVRNAGVVKSNATDARPSYADATRESPPKQQHSASCKACGSEGHDTVKCPNLINLSYDEKSAHIRQRKICYGCLLPGHTQRRCSEPPTCGKCGKLGHNELFCGWRPQPAASAPAEAATDVPTPLVDLNLSSASE